MRKYLVIVFIALLSFPARAVAPENVNLTVDRLVQEKGADRGEAEKGVRHIAGMWREKDGTDTEFEKFCLDNYITDPEVKKEVFHRVSEYMEAILGYSNRMSVTLQKYAQLDLGPVYPSDLAFSAYNPLRSFTNDMFANKSAFIVALNFPKLTIEEKNALGGDRLAWAYARLGDEFGRRPEGDDGAPNSEDAPDAYIDNSNIYMGHLVTGRENEKIFPDEMILLSHWNLRDEIKANYNKGFTGTRKQRMIYSVMMRIISQEIPVEVINSPEYDWDPEDNVIFKDGKAVSHTPEDTVRYAKMLNNYHAARKQDKEGEENYMERHFRESMEIPRAEVEQILDEFLTSPELADVGMIVRRQLGRPIEAFDIWYDGFKQRSKLDEEKLSQMTRQMYPDAPALEAGLPEILMKLGFAPKRARELASKIGVDPARGSGHAWGAEMKGQKSLLRTRIPKGGLDYKGFNIAVHELGHNVEQTISLYEVDYYMMHGVPNTSFTEALAFVFQQRDLGILGMAENDAEGYDMYVLDKIWSLFEISGVSMLDIAVWKWMYSNPDATAAQLRDATIQLSKEVWNKYFYPVFGMKDQTVLAIYSHMINYPLYLSAYAFGQMIEFQLEDYLKGKDFASEVTRIYRLGRLTPTEWMRQATGTSVSAQPIVEAAREAVSRYERAHSSSIYH